MKKRILSILLVLSVIMCGLPSLAFVSAAADETFNVTVNAADGGKVSTDGINWSDSVVVSVTNGGTIGDSVKYKADEGYKLDSVIAPTAIKKVVASSINTAVIDASGNLYTAGDNARGQLGREVGSFKYYDSVLTKVNTSAKITDVAAGMEHIIILDENGDVWTAGSNQYGALGTNENVGKTYGVNSVFKKVTVGDGSIKIKAIAAGLYHTVLIDENGGVWTAGHNQYGALGRSENVGSTKANAEFKKADGLENVKIVSAAGGTYHTILLDENGSVWTAGTSAYGVLGRQTPGAPGNVTSNPVFEKVTDGISGVRITAIAAGSYHNVLLDENGNVWTAGCNLYGELGRQISGSVNSEFKKSDLQGAAGAKFIAAGNGGTIVIDTDGNARTCGIKGGQLGRDTANTNNPELLKVTDGIGDTKMIAAAAGNSHSILLDENGGMWSCGRNSCGQLCRTEGLGKYTSISTFAAVTDGITKRITFDAMKNAVITSDRVFTILFAERERIQVEYILDGGEWIDGFTPKDFVYKDEALLLPEASKLRKNGYILEEWEIPSPAANPIKCYAKWSEKADYTVKFDTGGGTTVADKTNVRWTDKILDGIADPTRMGYDFREWKYGDTAVTENTTYADLAVADTVTDIMLTAQWTVNQYTITIRPENGERNIIITQDYGTAVTAPALTRMGYTFTGWDIEFPATMPAENITITAQWKDTEKPTGVIEIGENKWNSIFNKITFGLFFNKTQTVMITASDNSGEPVTIEYLLSGEALTETELGGKTFTVYTEPFSINPDHEYIIYVKLTDTAGNVSYISSDGIVLDGTDPVISGIEDGKTYCESQIVTITEKYVDTITVNGTAVTPDEDNSFVLAPANGEQKIIVTDKAGNTVEMTVTVNDGHTFGEWTSNGDDTHTRKCTVDGCDGFETNDCSGGKATCTEKAVCRICGMAYGKIDQNNHADLRHNPANVATKNAEGNIEYWYCEGCGRYYSDAEATKEIAKTDIVTKKLPEEPKTPQTGDYSNFMLWFALLFISGGAVIGMTVVSRKTKYNR